MLIIAMLFFKVIAVSKQLFSLEKLFASAITDIKREKEDIKEKENFLESQFIKLNIVYGSINKFDDAVRKFTDKANSINTTVRNADKNHIENYVRLNSKVDNILSVLANKGVTINIVRTDLKDDNSEESDIETDQD